MHRQQNGWIKERQRLRGRDPFSGTWNIDNKPVKTYRVYTFQILISENYGSAQHNKISTTQWNQVATQRNGNKPQHSKIRHNTTETSSTTTKLVQHNETSYNTLVLCIVLWRFHCVLEISFCRTLLGHRRKQWIYQHSDSSHSYRNSFKLLSSCRQSPCQSSSP